VVGSSFYDRCPFIKFAGSNGSKMATCNICLEESDSKSITCPKCSEVIHAQCMREHLLNTVLEPHCPSCSQVWTHDFVALHQTKQWRLGIYKDHRQAVLLDREKSLLPDTQAEALRVKEQRVLDAEREKVIGAVRVVCKTLAAELAELRKIHGRRPKKIAPEVEAKMAEVLEAKSQLQILQGEAGAVAVIGENKHFIQPCPGSGCRGFLGEDWKCKLCSIDVCSKCAEIMLNERHKCSSENVASFKFIKGDSKPCPKCGVRITKISGCDHMFCECKTAFSWRTREIHVKGNSNAEYWRWVATRPIVVAGGDACGLQDLLRQILHNLPEFGQPHCEIHNIATLITHLNDIVVPPLQRTIATDAFLPLRVNYLLKDITQDQWAVAIQRADKKLRKANDLLNVVNLFIFGTTDILRELHAGKKAIDEVLGEINNLRNLTNRGLRTIQSVFGSTYLEIMTNYSWNTTSPNYHRYY
jgi:hypothetical protein